MSELRQDGPFMVWPPLGVITGRLGHAVACLSHWQTDSVEPLQMKLLRALVWSHASTSLAETLGAEWLARL